jgi:hypothetical protein
MPDVMDRCSMHADMLTAQAERHTAQLLAAAKVDADLRLLCERIPADLKTEFAIVKTSLSSLQKSFDLLRAQVYWVISVFVGAFILGVTTFIIRGGLK